ncbi:hypothetical protein [Sphingomonas sp. Root710]|uniref:hypothetical protein n=1 Tax=Sphingomonas sp. Root710 TaxID=1736594 RepID=UPI0012E3FA44|nr:hypothetical protein [Sphingomonas sp. Root710]
MMVEQYLRNYPDLPNLDARELLRRLKKGVATQVPSPTAACPVFTDELRHRVVGNLWPHVEDELAGIVVTATLMPTGLWVPAGQLQHQIPRLMMRRLCSDFDRVGVTTQTGFVMAGLHAEFDERREGYDFHYHLVAGGWKARALEALRDRPKYSVGRSEPHEMGMADRPRVRISKQVLTNLPDPLTYSIQYWYPHRPTKIVGHNPLQIQRSEFRYRIPEPYHTEWMVWMDKHPVQDFVLFNGLKPTRSGLKPTK